MYVCSIFNSGTSQVANVQPFVCLQHWILNSWGTRSKSSTKTWGTIWQVPNISNWIE
jgi:hypothetical protein